MQAGTNNKPTLYFIPGLAADERLFHRYRLKEDYECYFLNWVDPLPGEDMNTYAKRFADQVDTSRPFVLIGCSLGGIMSVEMSRHIEPQQIILLSSLRHAGELPWYLRLFRYMPLYQALPFWTFERALAVYRKFFSRTKSKEQVQMLHDMVRDTSPKFFKWGIHQVLHWKTKGAPENVAGIHGGEDWLFPSRYVKNRTIIEKGNHFMVVLFSEPIEKEIRKILEYKQYN